MAARFMAGTIESGTANRPFGKIFPFNCPYSAKTFFQIDSCWS